MPRVLETYVQGLVLRVPGNHVLRADNDGIIGNNPRNDIAYNSRFILFCNERFAFTLCRIRCENDQCVFRDIR